MKTVSIITVNYNHHGVTEALLASLSAVNNYPLIEIIVVDNGSRVNPVTQWQHTYPDVTFIRSEENLGFAGGNNLGINHATGDYLFLINNDTEVTGDLISILVNTLEKNPNIGIISPKINYFDNKKIIQYAGFTELNFYVMRDHTIGEGEEDKGQYNGQCEAVGSVHGAAMMVRREAMEKCGMMADNFFLYYEELDWCYRMKRMGYEVWVNRDALIYHKESMSVGKNSALKEYFMNRNRLLFIRRNGTLLQRLVFTFYFVFLVAPRNIINYIKDKQTGFIPILLRAIWWNFTNNVNSKKLGYHLTQK